MGTAHPGTHAKERIQWQHQRTACETILDRFARIGRFDLGWRLASTYREDPGLGAHLVAEALRYLGEQEIAGYTYPVSEEPKAA